MSRTIRRKHVKPFRYDSATHAIRMKGYSYYFYLDMIGIEGEERIEQERREKQFYTDNVRPHWPGRTWGRRHRNRMLRRRANAQIHTAIYREDIDVVITEHRKIPYSWWYD